MTWILVIFDAPPEDGSLIAETCVEVADMPCFVGNSCALVGLA
jgi:hypothetical protein